MAKKFQFFDEEFFSKFHKSSTKEFKKWIKLQQQFLSTNLSDGLIVLDIGCGSGEELKVCSKISKKVFGIDNSQNAVKIAKKNLKDYDNIEIILENAEKMHFKDNFFDIVYCFGNTFGNWGSKKRKILKEMLRILKPGGKIWINVWAENSLNMRLKAYKRIGLKIKKVADGAVTVEDGKQKIALEQFDKETLRNLFNIVNLKLNFINNLTNYSYICELEKIK